MNKLKSIFRHIPNILIKGSKDVEVTGICANSRLVSPGNLFIAKLGLTNDGSQYIEEAVSAGAAAILTDIYNPFIKIAQVIHPNVAEIEGLVAANYYERPSDKLFMVGVTGTNGKTTSSFIIKHLLDQLDGTCGLIGTIEYITGVHRYTATKTTPEVATNHKMLKEMVLNGCKSAVMEVSSHALNQGRVDYIDYDVAVFTNLTSEHLDYHKTIEEYALAKQKLFTGLGKEKGEKSFIKTAVINSDDPFCQKMLEHCQTKVLTYGITSDADLKAYDIKLNSKGSQFKIDYQEKTYQFDSKLVGRFNVYNLLAAIAVAFAKGYTLDQVKVSLNSASPVKGRIETVPNKLGLNIYVDFAHSADALKNVLECLKEFKKGKIYTLFGCGGDRDKIKRPQMASVAEDLSDYIIVTTDNPRTEDPLQIIKEIEGGFKKKGCHEVVVDRYKAIEYAISKLKPDDVLLIAGKGHETYQIFAHKTIEFDDRLVVIEICKKCALETV